MTVVMFILRKIFFTSSYFSLTLASRHILKNCFSLVHADAPFKSQNEESKLSYIVHGIFKVLCYLQSEKI